MFFSLITGVIALILVTPIFLLALPFWIISLLTRSISRFIEPQFLTRDQLIEFDPIFGWKPRPNLNTHHLMVDLFQLTTDGDGWRGHSTVSESDIVVFGDSFAAGYGVSDRHLFANLSETPKIKPIGIGGYSMVQELLWMKRIASHLRGKLLVWFIYHGNDLYDNLSPDLRGYRKPFIRERGQGGDWEIVSSHVNPERWSIVTRVRLEGQHHIPLLAELCSETFLADRAYSACEYLIRAGKEICREAGAKLTVLTIPDPCQLTPARQRALKARGGNRESFDPYLPDKRIEAACQRLRVAFIAGRTFLDADCYKVNDCHWNERGHRRISQRLADLYLLEKRLQLTVPETEKLRALVQT